MDVLIAGGHGQIARRLIRILAAAGHTPRGLIRNPDHAADIEADGGVPVVCDLEREDPAPHLAGADAIVFAAGAGPGSGAERKQTVDLGAAVALIEAAEAHGVRRYVIVSSIGAHDPAAGPDAMRPYLEAKAEADARLAASDLDWTIVRPGSLNERAGQRPRRRVDDARAAGAGATRRRRARARRGARRAGDDRRHVRGLRRRDAGARSRARTRESAGGKGRQPDMKRIVERHLAKLRKAQQEPAEQDALRAQLVARLYPTARAEIRPVRHERIPRQAPDWYFEAELRRSGLWEMMERCYPSSQAQSQ